MHGQERYVLFVARDRPGPSRNADRRTLEHRGSVLTPQLLHERARSAGIRLEDDSGVFALAQRHGRRTLLLLLQDRGDERRLGCRERCRVDRARGRSCCSHP